MAFAKLANAGAASANATTATATIDSTGANLLVACVGSFTGTPTIADSVGGNSNTWTPLTQQGGGSYVGRLFWCVPTHVGSGHTFTGTAPFPSICVAAFSGAAASPYDQESGGDGVAQPGSITPAEDNELFVFGEGGSGGPDTVDLSFILTDSVPSGGPNVMASMAYLIQTTAAAKNPTWTVSANGRTVMATFKAAAGGGGGVVSAPWYYHLLGG